MKRAFFTPKRAPCPACEKRKAAIAAFAKTVSLKLKGKKK